MAFARYFILVALAGCAASTGTPATQGGGENTASEKEDVPGPVPQCLGEDGKQAECSDDRECCKGYYCGKDPEGNQIKRFCLYSGSQ